MRELIRSIRTRGGLAATFELYADGHDRHSLARAVRARILIRVRQGWYALPQTHPLLLQSVRVGGRATCVTGLSLHGVWTVPTSQLHVNVDAHASRLRRRDDRRRRLDPTLNDVRTHWRSTSDEGSRFILPPLECLRDAVECVDPSYAYVLGESLLHEHPALRSTWPELFDDLPHTHRATLLVADGICESGTEAMVWFRLRGILPIVRQVHVPGLGRVDFLVGSRLIIEVDGAAYHTDPARFENDRQRDAAASRLGFRVLRFSYQQVLERWDEVEAAIMAAVLRGDHD